MLRGARKGSEPVLNSIHGPSFLIQVLKSTKLMSQIVSPISFTNTLTKPPEHIHTSVRAVLCCTEAFAFHHNTCPPAHARPILVHRTNTLRPGPQVRAQQMSANQLCTEDPEQEWVAIAGETQSAVCKGLSGVLRAVGKCSPAAASACPCWLRSAAVVAWFHRPLFRTTSFICCVKRR